MQNIRTATTQDLAEIKRLIDCSLRTCVVDDEHSQQMLFRNACSLLSTWNKSKREFIHLVSTINDVVTGNILISNFERMHLCFVHPSHQRQGLGRSLVSEALAQCKLAGSSKVTLNSSSFAMSFYLSLGFTTNGEALDLPGGCIPLRITNF